MNTPKWLAFIGDRKINNLQAAQDYIQSKIIPQFIALGYGNYTVIRKSDNTPIGSSGLYNREGIEGIDIGFAFLPEFEGKGYAYEASHKIKELAINNFNIKKLNAITHPNNIASQNLLLKLGLTFQEKFKLPNTNEIVYRYELKI